MTGMTHRIVKINWIENSENQKQKQKYIYIYREREREREIERERERERKREREREREGKCGRQRQDEGRTFPAGLPTGPKHKAYYDTSANVAKQRETSGGKAGGFDPHQGYAALVEQFADRPRHAQLPTNIGAASQGFLP